MKFIHKKNIKLLTVNYLKKLLYYGRVKFHCINIVMNSLRKKINNKTLYKSKNNNVDAIIYKMKFNFYRLEIFTP